MLKRALIVLCFLGFAAASLTANGGCTRKTTVVEHEHRWR